MHGLTFAVDDVVPASAPLPRVDAALAARLGGPLTCHSEQAADVVVVDDRHGLLLAVERAFTDHRPLLLTPDAVWLTITQGFARHVRKHHAQLRERFARHEGRKVLEVTSVDTRSAASWAQTLDAFAGKLGDEVGPGLVRALTCDFTTTTPEARTTSQLVLMNAFQRYFDYEVTEICGIPQVRLAGSVADWEAIRARLDVLREYELGWWVDWLAPVADQWVETARGDPDPDFWQAIYNPGETYGSQLVHGWLSRLYPYLDDAAERRHELAPLEGRLAEGIPAQRLKWLCVGVSSTGVEAGLSQVPVLVRRDDTQQLYVVIAGLLGVAQDDEGFLFPRIGWAVREDPAAERWARLRARGDFSQSASGEIPVDFVPAALLAFYDQSDGARLDGGRLVLAPRARLRSSGQGTWFGTLDGAPLTYRFGRNRQDVLKGDTVIARSVDEFFARLAADVHWP
jgi:hypothetical protein